MDVMHLTFSTLDARHHRRQSSRTKHKQCQCRRYKNWPRLNGLVSGGFFLLPALKHPHTLPTSLLSHITILTMRLATRNIYLLGLASLVTAAEFNPETNPAGYDTSRVGPSNANCQRQNYQLSISSNNVVFKNVDSNANQVSILLKRAGSKIVTESIDLFDCARSDVHNVDVELHRDV